ncbi:MAG TPA: hypothetical protein VK702_12230 [Candidatus Acidoferrum sp.]|jgi:hypothetical protein|nr:hypothetical protein [Candidatus Acidoferrum sp.]
MSSQQAATLHITNGDAVVYLFKKAGVVGTHLPWRDLLHEGPVSAGVTLEQLSRVRAEYLAMRGFGKPIKLLHDFASRDATLRRAPEFSEIVLWFEHDLYDQLQLLQVLVELDGMSLEPGRVTLVQSDHYLGSMTADELIALLPRRKTVTQPLFDRARAAWDALGATEPGALFEASTRDANGLPYLRAALRRLCQEFPWSSDGLSRSQRHALQAVSAGPAPPDELFRRAQSREEAAFLGDLAFAAILRDLQSQIAPLVEGEEGALEVTGRGRSVLAGAEDWLQTLPLDRWIGGMHLTADDPFRWDDDVARFAS